jgi:hypothetical protein
VSRTGRAQAAAVGAGVVALYVVLAGVSGHLSVLARRPLLDGFVYNSPYRWVRPPPGLASSNMAPLGGTFTVAVGPNGSDPGVFSTKDLQVSLVFSTGAFASLPGQESVILTITPADPATFGKPPGAMTVAGNVYRLEGKYRPGGQLVEKLLHTAQVAMAYPAPANPSSAKHTIFQSTDGRTWRAVPSVDTPVQRQITGSITSLGDFAVGQTHTAATASPGGSAANIIPYVVVGVLVLAVVGLIARYELRERRRARSRQARRGSKGRSGRR